MLWQRRSSSICEGNNVRFFGIVLALSLPTCAYAQNTSVSPPPAPVSGLTSPFEDTPPVVVKTVQITGNKVIRAEDISRAAQGSLGTRPATRFDVQKAVSAVRSLYRKRGFTMAQITEAETTPDGILHLTIAEGVIRHVLIKGNTRTRRSTILQLISVKPGSVYNDFLVQKDRMRFARLGIFADISIAPQVPGTVEESTNKSKSDKGKSDTVAPSDTPKPGEPPPLPMAQPISVPEDVLGQIDIVVRVKDESTVNIAATVGYTDSIGAVGFLDVSENNLLGTAQRVEVEWQRVAETSLDENGNLVTTDSRSAAGFSYEVPPLGTRSLAFGAQIYNQNTVFLPYFEGGTETIRTYERRSGVRGRIGKLFSDNFEGYVTVRRDIVGYDPVPSYLNPPLDALATADGTVGALGVDLIADGRDAADTPQHGYRYEVQYEHAGRFLSGDRVFDQTTLDLRSYVPLLPRDRRPAEGTTRKAAMPVFATRLMGGYSSGDVPLSEEFWLGGFDLLRGYDLFSIRGNSFVLGTAEARIPLGSGLQGVIFSDVGNAWLPGQSATVADLKIAAGLGLRFLSPIGPIRLDAAYGSHLHTYISLGQSF
jgi:outer membrane protein assembly factor BamA